MQKSSYSSIEIRNVDQHHFNNPTGHLNQGLDAARHYYNVELMAQRWQEQQERHLTICHFGPKKRAGDLPKTMGFWGSLRFHEYS